ncbi:hypothetical protein ABK040_015569 [Willaertia magna]
MISNQPAPSSEMKIEELTKKPSSEEIVIEDEEKNNSSDMKNDYYKDIPLEEFSHLSKSLQNRLGSLKLIKEKGNELFRNKEYEKAIEEYSKVDKFMGVLFKQSESTPEELAMALPFQTLVQLNMAQCYMNMEKYQNAITCLEQTEIYNKELKDVAVERKCKFRKAKCLIENGNDKQGFEMFEELKKKHVEDTTFVQLIDAEIKKYKKLQREEAKSSNYKQLFKKTELYEDKPPPTITTTEKIENISDQTIDKPYKNIVTWIFVIAFITILVVIAFLKVFYDRNYKL